MAHVVLRLKEVRRRLGICNTKLYEDFLSNGRLPTVRLGARSRGVLEADLDKLIEQMLDTAE
jgi:predicted DNA-binding transcriptional regulator AlpA